MTVTSETYGMGGYDPASLNGNLLEQTVDNGDGTATTTRWDAKGNVVEETTTPYERPAPPPLDTAAQTAALLAAKGVITEDEAADITGHPKERLAAEVEAWAAAEELAAKR